MNTKKIIQISFFYLLIFSGFLSFSQECKFPKFPKKDFKDDIMKVNTKLIQYAAFNDPNFKQQSMPQDISVNFNFVKVENDFFMYCKVFFYSGYLVPFSFKKVQISPKTKIELFLENDSIITIKPYETVEAKTQDCPSDFRCVKTYYTISKERLEFLAKYKLVKVNIYMESQTGISIFLPEVPAIEKYKDRFINDASCILL